jgi:hypothetical protein
MVAVDLIVKYVGFIIGPKGSSCVNSDSISVTLICEMLQGIKFEI